jgi:hypothetical protein
METSERLEVTLFRLVVAVLALIPISAGSAGIVLGPAFLATDAPWGADLDSHLRFLSGVFLVIGLAYWSCLKDLRATSARFRLLGLATIAGGLARFYSLSQAGWPSLGHQLGLVMELVVVPLLLLWHLRLMRRP